MGGPTFGRYQLGPQLAVGGMGEVFLATQLGLGAFAKPLVLKFLLPHLAQSPRAVEMFLTEARLASRMNHPNVVQIFDVGIIDGRYFIAMELVRGVSLARLIEALRTAGRALEPQLLVAVARSLCDGLHHAHEQVGPDGKPMSLIHRDITPENVLISVDGQVKLTDFGVARAQDQEPDLRVVGKLGYIAPEILDGKQVDRRVDVYSLGVTLFALATLERPFSRSTRDETASAVRRGQLPDLRARRPDLGEPFVAALERAADKEPDRRFATARELREALPAATRADAAEALGALVLELCGHQVSTLEERIERTAALKVTQATGTVLPASEPTISRRAFPWGLAAAGVGGLLIALVAFAGGRAAPAASDGPEAVVVEPAAEPSKQGGVPLPRAVPRDEAVAVTPAAEPSKQGGAPPLRAVPLGEAVAVAPAAEPSKQGGAPQLRAVPLGVAVAVAPAAEPWKQGGAPQPGAVPLGVAVAVAPAAEPSKQGGAPQPGAAPRDEAVAEAPAAQPSKQGAAPQPGAAPRDEAAAVAPAAKPSRQGAQAAAPRADALAVAPSAEPSKQVAPPEPRPAPRDEAKRSGSPGPTEVAGVRAAPSAAAPSGGSLRAAPRLAVAPAKGPPRPAPRSKPAAVPRAVEEPGAAEPGFLVVDAQPWAEVFINAKHVGETPIASYPMQPGTARVELKNPETGRSLVRSVVVRRGERAYVTGDLR